MKCISLWQPWATLWMVGAKLNETRSWSTLHRGRTAVHAAQHWSRELEDLCFTEPFASLLSRLRPNAGGMFHLEDALPSILPRGVLLGTLSITGCTQVTDHNIPAMPERALGDYRIGRFMWHAGDRRPLAAPVAFKGGQRLFNVPDELLRGVA